MEKVTLWGLSNSKRWVKRRSFKFNHEFRWNRSDFARPYEEKHGTIHAFFPVNVNPNEHPIFIKMLNIVNKKVKGFKTDFFYHDCISLFNYNHDVIWVVRESGTYMYEVTGEYIDEGSKETNIIMYGYREGCDYSYYRIQNSEIKKIAFEQGLDLLERKPIKNQMKIKFA